MIATEQDDYVLRPIANLDLRTPQEVFDIMCNRFKESYVALDDGNLDEAATQLREYVGREPSPFELDEYLNSIPPREAVIQRALLWAAARRSYQTLPLTSPQLQTTFKWMVDCEDRLFQRTMALAGFATPIQPPPSTDRAIG